MFTFLVGLSAASIILDLLVIGSLLFIEENEAWPASFLVFGLVGLGLYFGFGINIVPIVIANPLIAVAAVAGYLVFGILWSILSWYLYINSEEIQKELTESWEKWRTASKAATNTEIEAQRTRFLDSAVHNPIYRKGISLSNKNNWKIVNWIIMWPVSFVWRFARTLTIDFGKLVLSIFGKVYDKISNSATNNLK